VTSLIDAFGGHLDWEWVGYPAGVMPNHPFEGGMGVAADEDGGCGHRTASGRLRQRLKRAKPSSKKLAARRDVVAVRRHCDEIDLPLRVR
jgi:hypothetical protein